MWDFKINVETEIDYDSKKPEGYEYESRYMRTDIKYHFDLELREWGIKNFSFYVPDQEIELEIELQPQNSEDFETSYVTFKLNLHDIETELPENFSRGDIYPQSLTLEIEEITKVKEGVFQGKATGSLSFESA